MTDHLVIVLGIHVPAENTERKPIESRTTTGGQRLPLKTFAN
jgi:hypothetical protein